MNAVVKENVLELARGTIQRWMRKRIVQTKASRPTKYLQPKRMFFSTARTNKQFLHVSQSSTNPKHALKFNCLVIQKVSKQTLIVIDHEGLKECSPMAKTPAHNLFIE